MNFIKNIVKKAILIFLIISLSLVVIFKWLPVPFSAFMLSTKLANFSDSIDYDWVSYDEISPNLLLAAIASEDQKFPTHFGVDISAIKKAYQLNKQSNKKAYGASTITQQTAKNLFLWSGKSYIRKGIEVYFTFLLELFWSKERILEVYLNVAQFGESTFGVKAASEKYLKQKPIDVSSHNAARLVALLPSPHADRFYLPNSSTRNKIDHISRQMRQLGGTKFLEELN